ncbi:MAG: hypothetical protein F6K16_31135 [Symploca sp. SIO2B6]|nr:hypothetical protein [Symploca sp. SIO2B6]
MTDKTLERFILSWVGVACDMLLLVFTPYCLTTYCLTTGFHGNEEMRSAAVTVAAINEKIMGLKYPDR